MPEIRDRILEVYSQCRTDLLFRSVLCGYNDYVGLEPGRKLRKFFALRDRHVTAITLGASLGTKYSILKPGRYRVVEGIEAVSRLPLSDNTPKLAVGNFNQFSDALWNAGTAHEMQGYVLTWYREKAKAHPVIIRVRDCSL